MTERPSQLDRPSAAAEAQAAAWLARREGGLDVEADAGFRAWLAADADHVRAWDRVSAFWDRMGELAGDPLVEAMVRDALTARPRRPAWGLPAAGIAAALVIAVTGWLVVAPRLALSPAQAWIAPTAQATFANGGLAPQTLDLPDGSHVTLAAGSAIAVAMTDRQRAVRLLRGRAFFAVVHDARRPFRVEAADRWVSDLGTAFDVDLTGPVLAVTVATGKVSVASPQTPRGAVLAGGQKIAVSASGALGPVTAADLDRDLAWRSGMIEFRDAPLDEAVREINRYGGAPASVRGADGLKVSGRFRTGDPRRFAHALAEVYPVEIHDRTDGGADIVGRPR